MLLTAKMKKTTVCRACVRSELALSSGRMSTMEAPMVPMKLASTAPDGQEGQVGPGSGDQVAGEVDAARRW